MSSPYRLLVFADCVYREVDGAIEAEQAFGVFLAALTDHVDELTIVGRLDPSPQPGGHPLSGEFTFVALPHYALASPRSVFSSLLATVRQFNRAVSGADTVWLQGPHPHALLLVAIALLRRRRIVLGVRQDYPRYVRNRRPGSRWMHRCADLLESMWRALARHHPVVAVGPDLAGSYRHAPAVLESTVSLVGADDIAAGESARARRYDGELCLLSVGRLDPEKNPLLLVDVLRELRIIDPRWRLRVCGEGSLRGALDRRLAERGLAEFAELSGYLPLNDGLLDAYRASHAFLHVSLTEGVPQVLIEAFASGLPVVATAVGGVAAATGGAALLVAPRDAQAAASAVARTAAEAPLREALISAGFANARSHTLDGEAARVVSFIRQEPIHA
jgi:glycosyltransferase involved in cell wall biosynthesis